MLYTHTHTHIHIFIHTHLESFCLRGGLLYYCVVTFFMPFNFDLKSALSDVSIAVPVWFDFGFCLLRILFLYPCAYLCLYIYLLVRWVSCRQQTVAPPSPSYPEPGRSNLGCSICLAGTLLTELHSFIDSAILHVLVRELRLFVFRVIILSKFLYFLYQTLTCLLG